MSILASLLYTTLTVSILTILFGEKVLSKVLANNSHLLTFMLRYSLNNFNGGVSRLV
jgi:hypothetical protein